MFGEPVGIAAPCVLIARLGSVCEVAVQQTEQARIGILIAAMRGRCEQEQVARGVFREPFEQSVALLCALLATTNAGVGLVNNDEARTSLCEAFPSAVGLDVVEADDGVGIDAEDGVAERQSAFQRTGARRCDGHGINIELFRQLADPLIHEMRRTQHGKALDLTPVDHLAQDHARLNGLSDTNVIGNEQPFHVEPQRHEQGNELVCARLRHAHGDLHLANIAIIDDEPVLFDCLEFDSTLATTDVLYDLAFLLMDLWARGFQVQANLLLNRYLDVSPQDEPGIALMPLFLSIRATIRAHALAAQAAASPDLDLEAKALHYLALADDLLVPASPRLVAIGGLSGTGKSTIAKLVAPCLGRAPGARVLRSDVMRKRLAGVPPETTLRRASYTSTASAAVYDELERLASHTLQAGQAAIADAVFARPEERDAINQVARRRGVPFEGIWLEASPDLLKQRITARANDASDADAAVAEAQAHYDIGGVDWHKVRADAAREVVADKVRTILVGEDL
ncbi:MAG: hypothetical protein BGP16_15500 [Sphingobium sp. 66-54]|nr:MAG: hypothetical protein BGP16_15500 [Sphingobium sp. 66-54]